MRRKRYLAYLEEVYKGLAKLERESMHISAWEVSREDALEVSRWLGVAMGAVNETHLIVERSEGQTPQKR